MTSKLLRLGHSDVADFVEDNFEGNSYLYVTYKSRVLCFTW